MALDKLDLLVLKALALAPLHGYGIGQRIAQLSGGELTVTLGALYPALQRLERLGLVAAGRHRSARRSRVGSGRQRRPLDASSSSTTAPPARFLTKSSAWSGTCASRGRAASRRPRSIWRISSGHISC
jgi:Transcriptional regulator PadR-like family